MKRVCIYTAAREVAAGTRRELTGYEFVSLAGWSLLYEMQAATGVSDKQINKALLEDNILVTVEPARSTDPAPPVAYLRGSRDIALRSWTAKLLRPVRPTLRRRPSYAHSH
ncbi:hypothetical protein V1281_004225 [Nitrobacteraceae bacterium AZCC 2161]